MENIKTDSPYMQARTFRRVGSIRACVLLGACDIGRATIDGWGQSMITWGRNLTRSEADRMHALGAEPVRIDDCWEGDERREAYELIIPPEILESLGEITP